MSEEFPLYEGPTLADTNSLEGGIEIPEYGIILGVGPSVVAAGERGLFIALESYHVDECLLPAGLPLCGYAQGTFQDSFVGDKTVGFSFSSPDTNVFFDGCLLKLGDVLNQVATDNEKENACRLLGHQVSGNHPANDLIIQPDSLFKGPRYFVPHNHSTFTARELGQYANDFAGGDFAEKSGKLMYVENASTKNILALVWRLQLKEKTLFPTWPVTTLATNVLIKNYQPMEIGCTYGWRFWGKKYS